MQLWHYYVRSYLPIGFAYEPGPFDTCASAWVYQSSAWDSEVAGADASLRQLPGDLWRGVYDYTARRWVKGVWLSSYPGYAYGCVPIAGRPGCWRCPPGAG